jgi:hypothetical protein
MAPLVISTAKISNSLFKTKRDLLFSLPRWPPGVPQDFFKAIYSKDFEVWQKPK